MAPDPAPLHGPTLRATATEGRDRGAIAFGSTRDWIRALPITSATSVSRVARGGSAAVIEFDRSFWRLELHRVAAAALIAAGLAAAPALADPAPRAATDTLETIAMAAQRPGRDPSATLASIADAAAGPLSDQGRLQVGAALADVVERSGGALPFEGRGQVVALLLNRLAAHGVVVREAGR